MTSAERPSEIVFRGIDGNECEEFIAAIEELAFTEGWSNDQGRMLLFARSRLRHKALRWFARLDPSKKKDWDLFVEALFDHYSLVETPPEVETATPIWSETTFSPGASTTILFSDRGLGLQSNIQDERQTTENRRRQSVPPNGRAYDPSFRGRQLGLLRIVPEDGMARPQYIWRGQTPFNKTAPVRTNPHDQTGTTIDRQEALVICFISTPEPHPIGCLNAANGFGDLSLSYSRWGTDKYELRIASGMFEIDGSRSGDVSCVWSILSDGSLEASLAEFDHKAYGRAEYTSTRKDFKTIQAHLDTSGASVHFVKPGTPLRQDDPKLNTQSGRYEIKARLVFEPL